mmetsp:Transcript_90091/g.160440  ORF Transcript_90091/g.160440 Transcript_90091/m.160440 type:complete len:417 (+) Transcript_90091:30-1280(+)
MVALVPSEVLQRPPSREDGIDEATEDTLRRYGAELIRKAGFLLKLPQLTVASAASMFQRFYFIKSFAEFEVRALASAALILASKLEERPRKLHEVVQVFFRLQMRAVKEEDGTSTYAGKPTPGLDYTQREFADVKKEVLNAERAMLRELGFEVKLLLDHPHRYVLEYLDLLNRPAKLTQKAWSYANDSLQTSLCCSHQPHEIAAASLFLAARSTGLKLPSKPAWWEVLGAETKEAERIAKTIMALYSKPPAEHVSVPRRKAVVPEGPMTPFPETPAPMKSPSEEDERVDPVETGDAVQQEAGSALDEGRIEEMLDEPEGADAAPPPAASSPPPSPPQRGFDKPGKARADGKKDKTKEKVKEREKEAATGKKKKKEEEPKEDRRRNDRDRRGRDRRAKRSASSSYSASSEQRKKSRR